MTQPDLDLAELHLDTLFGDERLVLDRAGNAGWVHVAFIPERVVTETGKVAPARWRDTPYRWPHDRQRLLDAVAATVEVEADIYFTPALSLNPSRGDRRKPHRVAVLWTDLDVPPTGAVLDRVDQLVDGGAFTVESGTAGHVHVYVPLDAPAAPQVAVELNRRLCAYLAGDPAVSGHGAMMRLPGSWNFKAPTLGYGPAAPVPLDRVGLGTYTVEQLDELLPEVPPAAEVEGGSIAEAVHVDDEHLDPRLLQVLYEPVDTRTDGRIDRSARTMALARHARLDGLGEAETIGLARRHLPTQSKYGPRGDLDRQAARCWRKADADERAKEAARAVACSDAMTEFTNAFEAMTHEHSSQ